ncbi:MAG: hypothetical protein HYW48_07190 [Deltaproteobacteria bacterium]|nr:hypothetical protein [Deltaproteobacteria bacterium]
MIIQSINASLADTPRAYEWKFHQGIGAMSRTWVFHGRPYELELMRKACDALCSANVPQEFGEITFRIQDDGGKTLTLERNQNSDHLPIHSLIREAWDNGVGLSSSKRSFATKHYIVQAGNPPLAFLADLFTGEKRLAKDWVENELTENLKKLQKLCQTQDLPTISLVKKLMQELVPLHSLLLLLDKHYGKYLHNKNTLGALPERRRKLREELSTLDKVEATLLTIETQSKLLLTPEEEENIRNRVAKNLKDCHLNAAPSISDLPSWSDLIRCLGEIKFSEKIIQLSTRLGESYDNKIKSFLLDYKNQKKNLQEGSQNLLKQLGQLKAVLVDDSAQGSSPWNLLHSARKALSPGNKELVTKIREVEAKLRKFTESFPTEKDFVLPREKLSDFLGEEAKKLVELKDKWKTLTNMPLQDGLADFFRYGLQYFELLWYNQILTENQRIKAHIEDALSALNRLLDGQHPQASFPEARSPTTMLRKASELVADRPARMKKLERLEQHIAKLNTRHEIRTELGQKKQETTQRWSSLLSDAKMASLNPGSPESDEFFALGHAILSLEQLKARCVETIDLFPHEAPAHLCSWSIDLSAWSPSEKEILLKKVEKLPSQYLNLVLTGDQELSDLMRRRSLGWIEQNLKHTSSQSNKIPTINDPIDTKKGRGEKIVDLLNGNRI